MKNGPVLSMVGIKKFTNLTNQKPTSVQKLMHIARQAPRNSRFLNSIFSPKLKAAYIELTNNCNLNCKMCSYKKLHTKTGYMQRSMFESYVDQLSAMDIDILYLHFGGESLLHPEFESFLKYSINKRNQGGIKMVSWVDNGMLFNQKIADLVVDLKVDSVSFSIDGVGEVNDNIRLGSKYAVLEKNIKYLVKKRGERVKPKIYMIMVDYGKTEEQKTEVYKEWAPVVDEITLIPAMRADNTIENKEAFYNKYQMAKPNKFCFSPFETMAISWEGKVTGCCLDYVFDMNLGDATKQSLKQIWLGTKYKALRKAALNNKFPENSACNKCEFWQINFQPKKESIADGRYTMEYGHTYRKVHR